MTESTPLVVDGLAVHFGGVTALKAISLAARADSVHGVIGPNGSGKTTMLNAVCGFIPCGGDVRLFGRDLAGLAPHRRVSLGLGRTFQNPRAPESLTVRELLRIGEYQRRTRTFWREALLPGRSVQDARDTDLRARGYLDDFEVGLSSLDAPIQDLPQGVLKMLDLVRALMGGPRVLLLDEPTSGLNEGEIHVLGRQLQRLRERGLTVVLVEHNLRFLNDVCDQVTVLDAGRTIAQGSLNEVLQLPQVVTAYLGEEESVGGEVE